MKNKKYFKILSFAAAVCIIAFSFVGCSSKKQSAKDNKADSGANKDKDYIIQSDGSVSGEKFENPVTSGKPADKTQKPDPQSIKLADPSTKVVSCANEDECADRMRIFANPNGNEYDALSIVGKFAYPDKDDAQTLEQLKTASKTWHQGVTEKVGEKCIVNCSLKKKTPIDLSDARVTQWNESNQQKAQAYTNVKCAISTNYVNSQVVISFDMVKVDGSWYLATKSTLSKLQHVITTELYKK